MSAIHSISNAIEFIEHNLKEEISLEDVADAVFYSLFHFCRMFNSIAHHTPYDYLMRRRLSEAARELVATDQKIIEIAFEYQFNSPETFARAFKRMFGMQPSQWRKQGRLPTRRLMPKLSLAYLEHLNQGEYLKPIFEDRAPLHIAGLMHVTQEHDAPTDFLWKTLYEILDQNAINTTSQKYRVSYYPDDWEHRGVLSMVGVDAPGPAPLHPALVIKTLPASLWACFVHHGTLARLALTREYVYHTWLPKSGKRLAFPLEVECYGADETGHSVPVSDWQFLIPILP